MYLIGTMKPSIGCFSLLLLISNLVIYDSHLIMATCITAALFESLLSDSYDNKFGETGGFNWMKLLVLLWQR